MPAFAALAELAARYHADASAAITSVPAEKVSASGPPARGQSPAQHVHAQRRRPAHQRHSNQPRHRDALRADRRHRPPGRQRGFSQSAGRTPSTAKIYYRKKWQLQRIGRERKPLGPPAKPGNCAAYDIFTAILEGRPYPVKALLNFGSNTVMSTGDSERAREAFRAVDFAVAAELFMTPTAALCDYVLPATSFLEMANMAARLHPSAARQTSFAISSRGGGAVGRTAFGYLDHFRIGQTGRARRSVLEWRYRSGL